MTRPATSGAREGCEKEEPKEPPRPYKLVLSPEPGGYVRIIGGAFLLGRIEYSLKEPFYHYNSLISSYGYYVKPVHKVYKSRSGSRIVYIYYGRYWFKKGPRGRLIYAGTVKPEEVPVEPPPSPLEGVTLIVDGGDLLVSESGLDRFLAFVRRVIGGLELSYRR